MYRELQTRASRHLTLSLVAFFVMPPILGPLAAVLANGVIRDARAMSLPVPHPAIIARRLGFGLLLLPLAFMALLFVVFVGIGVGARGLGLT